MTNYKMHFTEFNESTSFWASSRKYVQFITDDLITGKRSGLIRNVYRISIHERSKRNVIRIEKLKEQTKCYKNREVCIEVLLYTNSLPKYYLPGVGLILKIWKQSINQVKSYFSL